MFNFIYLQKNINKDKKGERGYKYETIYTPYYQKALKWSQNIQLNPKSYHLSPTLLIFPKDDGKISSDA